jgi:hypothetical protein
LRVFGKLRCAISIFGSGLVLGGDQQNNVRDGYLQSKERAIKVNDTEDCLVNIISADVSIPHGFLERGRESKIKKE